MSLSPAKCGGGHNHLAARTGKRFASGHATTKTGLDVLVADEFAPLRGLRVGVVTHPAAVDRELRHIIELLFGSGRERNHLEAGRPPAELHEAWSKEEEAFRHRRHTVLLYD